jgi:hypothetical protein
MADAARSLFGPNCRQLSPPVEAGSMTRDKTETAQARAARLAKALRDNLRRRKEPAEGPAGAQSQRRRDPLAPVAKDRPPSG